MQLSAVVEHREVKVLQAVRVIDVTLGKPGIRNLSSSQVVEMKHFTAECRNILRNQIRN